MKYLFSIIWLGLIFFASLTSSDKIPDFQLFPHVDKVIHFCMYLVLSFSLIPALLINKKYKKGYLLSFIISVFFGFLMEYFQQVLAIGRSAELFDFLANTIGSIAGILIYQLTFRNKIIEKKIFKI
jgi:VanZ family protein